jgi:hypothetical protein
LSGNVRIYPSRDEAILSYYSKKTISGVEVGNEKYGILCYKNGCNRGSLEMIKLKKKGRKR